MVGEQKFLWGASTAAHQVEGGTQNNWTAWEDTHAEELAKTAQSRYQHLPIWTAIAKEATNPDNYRSGKNSDHFNHYKQDFDLAKKIGLTAYRFSIEWSRIEPTKGTFDQAAINHYQNVIAALEKRQIQPVVCLWHWTVPLWFSDQGDWQNPQAPEYFSRFVTEMVRVFGKKVTIWVTLNEPDVYASKSYLQGDWPPQKKNILTYWAVLGNLIKAHKLAYKIIKANYPTAQVGIAKHMIYFRAQPSNPFSQIGKWILNWWWNWLLLNSIQNNQDFIGVNYYFTHDVLWQEKLNKETRFSDLGWRLNPEGITPIMHDLAKRYRKPIYITENGLADRDDRHRGWYLHEVIKHIRQTIQSGVDVRGYFHWSVLDNFEWAEGFWPRFGLIAIDYKTGKRTLRPSAREYSQIIQNNGDIGHLS